MKMKIKSTKAVNLKQDSINESIIESKQNLFSMIVSIIIKALFFFWQVLLFSICLF